MLRKIGDELWVAEHALVVPPGLRIGTRMGVVRLSDGGLFLHSPVPLADALRAALEALGPVRCIVAPNKLHWFYVAEHAKAFPEAVVYAAPGLAAKRPELPIHEELGERPPAAWSGDLEQVWVRGAPFLNEVDFFHPRSRTLLLTDLCFHIRDAEGLATRLFWRANGVWRRFGPSRMVRLTMRDKAAVRAAVDRILSWDFDRVTVTHGDVLETGGRDALREAYRGIG